MMICWIKAETETPEDEELDATKVDAGWAGKRRKLTPKQWDDLAKKKETEKVAKLEEKKMRARRKEAEGGG